jgi:HK97 family phage prohead protease
MIEFRELSEIRAQGPDTIMGWACRFDEPTDLGVFTEVVQRGAFATTIRQRGTKIRFLAGHNAAAFSLGSILKLEERDQGLWLEAKVADTTTGRDLLALVRDGHPVGLSMGFSVHADGQRWSDDRRMRTLTEVRLHEISAVGSPAYENAEIVGVRSLDSFLAATASLRVGKVLSASNVAKVREAIEALTDLLAAAEPAPMMVEDEDDDDESYDEMEDRTMPYSVVRNAPGCDGWAVLKDGTGEVMGCHRSEDAAQDQLTALNIAEFGDDERADAPPAYIRRAARRGLELQAQGLGGDGLVDRTIREAREMAAGRVSDDKAVRANAWAARHAVDLRSPANSDPQSDAFPGPGAVAHYLWGIDPLDPEPARAWFAEQASMVADRASAADLALRQYANKAELVIAGLL